MEMIIVGFEVKVVRLREFSRIIMRRRSGGSAAALGALVGVNRGYN